MLQLLIRRAALLVVFAVCGICGCGQTGSDPLLFPEVHFRVFPAGQATFHVDALSSGGASYTSVIGQQFTATAAFDFVLENAGPGFRGVFEVDPSTGDQITVTLAVICLGGQTQVSDSTGPGKPTATVSIPFVRGAACNPGAPPPDTGVSPPPSNPEVRIDICAPLPNLTTCSTTSKDQSFGVLFTGSLGDPFTSHLTSGSTPAIYFYQSPQQNINAVFTRAPLTGMLLTAQLLIDGEINQTRASTGNVIISQDL